MLGLAVCATLGAACSNGGSGDTLGVDLGKAGAGPSDAGASGDVAPEPNGIAFTTGAIELEPKETRELTVQNRSARQLLGALRLARRRP